MRVARTAAGKSPCLAMRSGGGYESESRPASEIGRPEGLYYLPEPVAGTDFDGCAEPEVDVSPPMLLELRVPE